jgi:hypothetical protein
MKTPDKYRFSLQWGAETSEKIQAGDFLETLGNRKSEVIVAAVTEYLAVHPEALTSGQKLKIVVRPSVTPQQMEAMVRAMIEERLAGIAAATPASAASDDSVELGNADISAMLQNLDLFS